MYAKFLRVVLALAVVSTVAAPVAAETDSEPSLVVSLEDDGTADLLLTLTYDLTTDTERDAFRTLQNDSDARTYVRERFRDRMETVAARSENATGREMSVDDATIDVDTTDDGETGIVKLGVTWRGFAAVEGDGLVVTEPFASGFEADRKVTLVAPDGYELASATPEPTTAADGRLAWESGTSLDGFEAAFSSADSAANGETTDERTGGSETTDEAETATSEVPGFGFGLATVSLLAAALLAVRR